MGATTGVFEAIANDREARIGSVRTIPVHELRGPATELLPPGSGAIIVAANGSEAFDELERAVAHNETERINEIVTAQKQEVATLSRVSEEEALATALAAPAYGDLRFGGKSIALNVFPVDNVSFTRVFFPFAGGSFDPHHFSFAEYGRDDNAGGTLDAMVVVHQPTLSARERAVLRRLPADAQEMRFGMAGDEVMCTPAALVATVTAGVIVATVGTALGHCAPEFEGIEAVINPATFTFDARTNVAVKQLVQARRQALLGQ